jgi:hypothetical protein
MATSVLANGGCVARKANGENLSLRLLEVAVTQKKESGPAGAGLTTKRDNWGDELPLLPEIGIWGRCRPQDEAESWEDGSAPQYESSSQHATQAHTLCSLSALFLKPTARFSKLARQLNVGINFLTTELRRIWALFIERAKTIAQESVKAILHWLVNPLNFTPPSLFVWRRTPREQLSQIN